MDERRAALIFVMAEGVGAATAAALHCRFGGFVAALEAALAGRAKLPGAKRRALRESADGEAWGRELTRARQAEADFIPLGQAAYPASLAGIARPPTGLFVRGRLPERGRAMLAVVGSRAATPRGRLFAREISASLTAHGLVIVSGLARGVDTAAHEGALDAGGPTLAVLGSGLDRVYPRENAGLADRIAAAGAVLTEFPFGTAPLAEHFPMRNRIVAGLSAGVLVVEAGERSGALITARMALDEGREVFAVPGPPNELGARGPNGLIRAGAKLVERAADVIEELEPAWGPFREPTPPRGDRTEPADPAAASVGVVRRCLGATPRTVEDIAAQVGRPVGDVLARLTELELAGLARAWPGGRYTRS